MSSSSRSQQAAEGADSHPVSPVARRTDAPFDAVSAPPSRPVDQVHFDPPETAFAAPSYFGTSGSEHSAVAEPQTEKSPPGAPRYGSGDERGSSLRERLLQGGFQLRALTVLLVFLIVIPSRLIFKPLGAAGTPAELLSVVLLGVWVFTRVSSIRRGLPMQPVQRATLVFVLAILISYVVAATRPIQAVELSGADRALLNSLGWLGVVFFTSELPSRFELDILLRRLTFGSGALAAFGVVQYATGMAFTNYIVIPGLTLNGEISGVLDRNGRNRPAGTASHPIEFGAVLTMILPIAIHYALHDTHRTRFRLWFPVAAIAIAIPISISRSAIVSAAVALIVLVPSWPTQLRRRAYGSILLLLGVAYMFVPGLIGTLTGLFTNLGTDTSAGSRTKSYATAFEFIGHDPLFGRGFGTFQPSYHILDNQYLGMAIEIGLFGVAAILGLYLTAIITSIKLRRASTDEATRNLAQSIAAGFAATTISSALYDAFAFPMATTLVFLMLGCAAALGRVSRGVPEVVGVSQEREQPSG